MISAKSFFLFLLGFLVAIIMFFADIQDLGSTFSDRRNRKPVVQGVIDSMGDQFQTYQEKESYLYEILQERYYDQEKIDLPLMKENALKGFVEALGDPHSEYLTREENEVFDESMEGTQHFEGIGAVVSKKQDGVMISEVLKGSPAFQAGLQPLDIIIQIHGESTQQLSLSDAVKKIRGPKGTPVQLTIFRQRSLEDEVEILDIEVTRGTIDVPSVKVSEISYTGGNALHIEVGIFGEDTIVKLQQALLQQTGSYDAVILDLRGNGGGYLPMAVELASFFLPKNEIVTTAKYTILPDEILRSKGYARFLEEQIVILIDGMSASASEIVAGALQQRRHAKLVGTTSFGKGSIQTIQPIDDGSMLKYTIGNWYLPNNTSIDEIGLIPDVEVEFDRDLFSASGVDLQLMKAIEILDDPQYRVEGEGCCANVRSDTY